MSQAKTIHRFEHQALKARKQDDPDFEGFKFEHLEALEALLGSSDEETFPYYSLIHHGVKFRQYVGVMCVGNLTIEVLPKTDDNDNEAKWQSRLLHMLSRIYKLDVRTPTDAPQERQANSPILDLFINKFLNEVDQLLNRGLVKCYHKEDKNLKSLKGKLLIGKHVTTNYVHKERFYVRYTTYDQEHVLNRVLRQAISIIPRVTSNLTLRGRASSTLFNFPEVHEIAVNEDLFKHIEYDRKTEDYREAIKIAQLLLLHFRPKNKSGNYDILALMFDMNKLWEEYVYLTLKKQCRKEKSDWDVLAQCPEHLWHDSGHIKHIKPDIVIKDNGKTYILDTKWKIPKSTPSDGDLHQLYAYLKRFQAEKVALVYPSTSESTPIEGCFKDDGGDKSCDMVFLSFEEDSNKDIDTEPIIKWLQSLT